MYTLAEIRDKISRRLVREKEETRKIVQKDEDFNTRLERIDLMKKMIIIKRRKREMGNLFNIKTFKF